MPSILVVFIFLFFAGSLTVGGIAYIVNNPEKFERKPKKLSKRNRKKVLDEAIRRKAKRDLEDENHQYTIEDMLRSITGEMTMEPDDYDYVHANYSRFLEEEIKRVKKQYELEVKRDNAAKYLETYKSIRLENDGDKL